MSPQSANSPTCDGCSRIAPVQRHDCDGHAPCPGYGCSTHCPPLIVLAVQECLSITPDSFLSRRIGHA